MKILLLLLCLRLGAQDFAEVEQVARKEFAAPLSQASKTTLI